MHCFDRWGKPVYTIIDIQSYHLNNPLNNLQGYDRITTLKTRRLMVTLGLFNESSTDTSGDDGYLDVVIFEDYNNVTLTNDIALIAFNRDSIQNEAICSLDIRRAFSYGFSDTTWEMATNLTNRKNTSASSPHSFTEAPFLEDREARVTGLKKILDYPNILN